MFYYILLVRPSPKNVNQKLCQNGWILPKLKGSLVIFYCDCFILEKDLHQNSQIESTVKLPAPGLKGSEKCVADTYILKYTVERNMYCNMLECLQYIAIF